MASGMRWTEEQLREFVEERRGSSLPIPRPAKVQGQFPAGKSAELSLRDQIVAAGLPEPFREFTFHPTRDWRLDLAWPTHKLAVEIDGQVHRTKERFARDVEKHNALIFAGWRYLRVAPVNVETGSALTLVKLAFERLA